MSNMSIFVFLLAVAALFHQLDKLDWFYSLPSFILSVVSILLLFKPWSVKLLLLFSISQIATVIWNSPIHSDHWLITSFLHITILFAFITVLVERGVFPSNVSALESHCFPLIRALFFIFYFFVVIHKLNQDYLNPQLSCAVALYGELAERFPIFPQGVWFDYLAIYGTIISEVATLVLVGTNRFRTVGLLYGTLFHFILGLDGYVVFSSMLIALYFSFAPKMFYRKLDHLWSMFSKGEYIRYVKIALIILWVLLFLTALVILATQGSDLNFKSVSRSGEYALWILYSPLIMVLYFIVIRKLKVRPVDTISLLKPRRLWHVSLLLILFFNGMCPYLGLKTGTSFSMLSNLHTEKGNWNHLILPEWMRIAHYQDNLVTIVSSSHAELQGYKERGEKLVTLDFQRIISKHCRGKYTPFSVQFISNEEFHNIKNACNSSILTKHLSSILEKLLVFQPVSETCTFGRPGRIGHELSFFW